MYLLFIVYKNGLNISTTKKNEVLIFFLLRTTKEKGSAPFFLRTTVPTYESRTRVRY